MRQILITVAGRNSAGKSLIAKKVAEALGLNVVKSYATRKPRPEELQKGIENCDHIFVSDEEYDKLENITAETEINGARYCTTQEILDNSDIYVIDPKGIKDLKERCGSRYKLLQFYIYADADKRAARFIARGESKAKFESREQSEDEQFCDYENNHGWDIIIYNNWDIDTAVKTMLGYVRPIMAPVIEERQKQADGEFEKMMNPNVAAVLINSPNNPSGAVYSENTIKKLAEILSTKQKEYGHDIFIISDEPYREIVFDGKTCPYVSKFYDNTLSCYSFSKSLSLPGERIGYVAANPRCTDADIIAVICGQISRGIGHNCPSSTIQQAVAKVIDQTSDMSVYEKNRNLLYDALTRLGFEVVKPQGTFYIFPKALEEDANAFCMKAKKYDLILVPADNFCCPGYFRMAYCIDTEKVERSIPVLEKFVREEYGK